MVPTRLVDWTLDVILELTKSGRAENDWFDFKSDLQPADKQRRAAAAFANSQGGFLIFGVSDSHQIVGVVRRELPRDFGNNVREGISPSIEFSVGTPISAGSDRLLFVVHIPKSSRAPHAVKINDAWVFLKRTAAGSNDPMTYEEIRLAFQDLEIKRSKLALTSSELEGIRRQAESMLADLPAVQAQGQLYTVAWLNRYPTTLLDSLLGDAFSLLASEGDAWRLLGEVRRIARQSNTISEALSRLPFSGIRGVDDYKQYLQAEVRSMAEAMVGNCTNAIHAISSLLDSTR